MRYQFLRGLKGIGPAIIVATVVLGPGSILTSSKVGAEFGLIGLFFVLLASILMIGMVALSTRLGLVYENSLCEELTQHLGRGASVFIGATLFLVVALFQSSNNIAVIAGIESLFESKCDDFVLGSTALRASILISVNGFVIVCLYSMGHVYSLIERAMKVLMLVMVMAFVFNFLVVILKPRGYVLMAGSNNQDLIPLLAMIGTTFSIGGAFYQAYLVREKGWILADWRQGITDSIFGISVLGVVTAVILMTSVMVFYGRQEPVVLNNVGDVARQLEPLFGRASKIIFCLGIFSGALSSFLVNAIIGGTVLSDSLGKGCRLDSIWPRHLTGLALLIGMTLAILSLTGASGTVILITLAQALTVLGLPALGLTLLYLGTRPELTGARQVPREILVTCFLGFLVSCVLAVRTAFVVYGKIMG